MAKPLRFFVFSHLRWGFVFQRPQHLLARFAKSFPVVFFEEPIRSTNGEVYWEITNPIANVTVVRLHSPLESHGFADDQIALMQEKMTDLDLLNAGDEDDHNNVVWFYTPLALPFLSLVKHDLVVFDSMDALDHFAHAPIALKARETELLLQADVVFTGGPSLYRRLAGRHDNLHCFSSSVESQHFEKAQDRQLDKNPAMPEGVKLGYVGVIDERIDLDLIAQVAAQRPSWQFVLVGPVVKIDPSSLPIAPNIHCLGQQDYADLPSFLAGWDICIQPFAHNASTKYISPTKTLEFFAASKPVVSTSITDVAEPYGHIVFLADDANTFVAQVQHAISLSEEEWANRKEAMKEVLANTSWEKTALHMLSLIDQALVMKQNPSGSSHTNGQRYHIEWDSPYFGTDITKDIIPHERQSATTEPTGTGHTPEVVVIGAGPTGLSAAYHLKQRASLLDKNTTVGGWCRSLVEGGFTFDFAGHIMFSNEPYVHEMYKMLLGDNCHWQDREAWIYSHGVHTRYPFQGALYGLPPDVIRECIMGAIEARFGSTDGKPANPPAAAQSVPSNGAARPGKATFAKSIDKSALLPGSSKRVNEKLFGDVKDCCADGVLEATAELKKNCRPLLPTRSDEDAIHHNGNHNGNNAGKSLLSPSPVTAKPSNFEEFIYQVWGRGIAKHFAIPYNRKLWAVPLSEMETSWLGGRVPQPNLEEMIDGALQPVAKPQGPNARFGYPLRGGFQSLMNGFLPHIEGELSLNTRIVKVSIRERIVLTDDGREIPFEVLVSTMPLPLLIKALGDEAPGSIHEAAKKLRYVSVRCVNLGIGREKITDKHWIYYPGASVFHRIFVQGNASPYCNPENGFGITCEITYSPHKPLPCDGDALVERCVQDCIDVGIIRKEDPVLVANQVDMPFAYVVYDHARLKSVSKIRDWLKEHRILLAGRYSEWEYYNSDHAFIAGKRAADEALEILRNNVPQSQSPL